MGQYFKIVNLTKRQFLHPHKFGEGIKLLEFGASGGGSMAALALLCSTVDGAGFGEHGGLVGTWAGDRIVVVGDYADTSNEYVRQCLAAQPAEAVQLLLQQGHVPALYDMLCTLEAAERNSSSSDSEGGVLASFVRVIPFEDISERMRAVLKHAGVATGEPL